MKEIVDYNLGECSVLIKELFVIISNRFFIGYGENESVYLNPISSFINRSISIYISDK